MTEILNLKVQHLKDLFSFLRPLKVESLLTKDNIRVARPGDGLCPSLWFDVLGAKAIIDMDIGHPLSKKDFR